MREPTPIPMNTIHSRVPFAAALLLALSTTATAQDWYAESPDTPPPARRFHAMFAMGRDAFLFGGVDEQQHVTFGDTWRYDGQDWRRLHGKGPSARARAAVAVDSSDDYAVLFGGVDRFGSALGDTWVFDGDRWQRRLFGNGPSPRIGASMAYDQPNGRYVLFGGMTTNGTLLADTWEFDGQAWHARPTIAAPSPRFGHAMAFDQNQSRTLLFGGYAGSSDAANRETWAWDGFGWQQLVTAHTPPAMVFPAMLWHATHGVAVLTGSRGAPIHTMVTSVFDGTDWVEGPAMTGIAPRQGHAMAFDSLREAVVLFGGATVGHVAIPRRDTWELSTQAKLRMFGSSCGPIAPQLWSLHGATPRLGTDFTMVMAPVFGESMLLAGYDLVAPTPASLGCLPAIDAYLAQPMQRFGPVAVLEMSIPGNRVLLGTVMYLQGMDDPFGPTQPRLTRIAELRFGN
jgi:hypothetical protein